MSDLIKVSSEKSIPPHKSIEYLGLEHLQSGSFDLEEKGASKAVKSICNVYKPGDVLYGKLRPNLDKAAIADNEGICTGEIMVLNATDEFSNELLLHHLHCPLFVDWNKHRAFGIRMPRTSLDIIGRYRILVPPKQEQSKQAAQLINFLDLERTIDKNIQRLRDIQAEYTNQHLSSLRKPA